MAFWSTKAAISLKRVKLEEKLQWRAYRNSPTLFRMVPSPTHYGLLCPKIGGSQPHPKLHIISVTGKATDFKFGGNIHRVHPNKSRLKILLTISGTGKATNFKFCRHFHRIDRNKSPLKLSGKVAVGALRDSRKFSGHPYIYGASRGHLCDSSAFLLYHATHKLMTSSSES